MNSSSEVIGGGEISTWAVVGFIILGICLLVLFFFIILYYVREQDKEVEEKRQADEKYALEAKEILKRSGTFVLKAKDTEASMSPQKTTELADKSTNLNTLVEITENPIMAFDEKQLDSEVNLENNRDLLRPMVAQDMIYASTGGGVLANTGLSSRHRKKRSRYFEAEIHSSEATVESEDLPSARLERTQTLGFTIGRVSERSKRVNVNASYRQAVSGTRP